MTHVLERRLAEDRPDRLPGLAADLVRLKVDVIVSASAPAAVVVKDATTSIPVVLARASTRSNRGSSPVSRGPGAT